MLKIEHEVLRKEEEHEVHVEDVVLEKQDADSTDDEVGAF